MDMNFDEIRCYTDDEVHEILEKLTNEKQFMKVVSTAYPLMPKEVIKERLLSYHSQYEFQKDFIYPFLQYLEENTTKGIELLGLEKIDRNTAYLYISNHRDIVLDSSFFCKKLMENSMNTVEIAIGDNLLIYPWIEDFVRVNKSFIVRRGLNVRQTLESSKVLAAYLLHTIQVKKSSIWMAQREGRAKDSDDRTQESILKMLNLSGKQSDFIHHIMQFNICPLSISYEYDPCDFLKAKEFQLKRDCPDYKKQPSDDLENMITGIMGYKGKVVFRITGCINEKLQGIAKKTSNRNEQISRTAQLIDFQIHANYEIYSVNKIAYDALTGENRFVHEYSNLERIDFEQYLLKQMNKIQLENKDEKFLRQKMLEMYANPLINFLKATNQQ
ncbi:MAG TPA: 1-acyl-sn-glycerol-3-phosphate acyltransferase [Paludibacteraceae bacterium]|nr:1-acyl-sn-glycerol-3-phosphate acyltransferase [Paludibacteraceae bacterium]